MCNNNCPAVTRYTSLHFRGAGPAQRPGIHKVHKAAVSSSSQPPWISAGKVVVVDVGTVATAIAIAERDGPRTSSPNH